MVSRVEGAFSEKDHRACERSGSRLDMKHYSNCLMARSERTAALWLSIVPSRSHMSEDARVDWQAIARQRWPLSEIRGDGPFVALPRGQGTVYLFNTVLERSTGAPPNSRLLTLRAPKRARKAEFSGTVSDE